MLVLIFYFFSTVLCCYAAETSKQKAEVADPPLSRKRTLESLSSTSSQLSDDKSSDTDSTDFKSVDRSQRRKLYSSQSSHLFGLEAPPPQASRLHDSRAINEDLKLLNLSFKDWHLKIGKVVEEKTKEIRKSLSGPYGTDNTNVLRFKLAVYAEDGTMMGEIEPETWFVSGWPTKYKRDKVKNVLKQEEVFFFCNLIDNFDARYEQEKEDICKEIHKKILNGYACDQHGFLVDPRITYPQRAINRSKRIEEFQASFLHTEQALVFYLAELVQKADLWKEIIDNITNRNRSNNKYHLALNIVSSRSVCLLCADRLFRESEWGTGFVSGLQSILGEDINLKLSILASSYEERADIIRDKDLLTHYRSLSPTEWGKIGFIQDGARCSIKFIDRANSKKRQEPDSEMRLPFIHHSSQELLKAGN